MFAQIKCIFGQTNNFIRRIAEHKFYLKKQIHFNPYLQKDYNLYGINSFIFDSICECSDKSKCNELEDYWIDYYGGIESVNVYNSQNNKHQNSTMKQKQNIKKIGSKRSLETRSKMSKSNSGKNNGMYKKHHSVSTRNRLSETHKGELNSMYGKRGKNNPNYGRKQSQECKEKCRQANLGKRKYSEQFINQLRQEYSLNPNYRLLSKRHNINVTSITNLIKYGTPASPNCYSK